MLKVYKVHNYVSIDCADWREVDSGYLITDEEMSNELILDQISFAEARETLSQKNKLYGVWNCSTLILSRPTIRVDYSDAWDFAEYTHFDTMSYLRKYEEWTTVPMQWLIEHASAEQFIQYLKERGITTCPMNI